MPHEGAARVQVVHGRRVDGAGGPARAQVAQMVGLRRQMREELQTPADAVVILMAARLEPWKGHRVLLEALQVDFGARLPPEAQHFEVDRSARRPVGQAKVRHPEAVAQREDVGFVARYGS